MKRDALIRSLRKEAKAKGLHFELVKGHGKGSHYRVRIGKHFTTLKSGELTPTYVRLVRKQLGLD